MNANEKIKTVVGSFIVLAVVVSVVIYSILHIKDAPITKREQCSNGSVDACKSYIQEQQSIYSGLDAQIKEVSGNANKAREIISQQLSGYFQ